MSEGNGTARPHDLLARAAVLAERDEIDLDDPTHHAEVRGRQHRAGRRILGKGGPPGVLHPREIIDVAEPDLGLEHVLHGGAGRLEGEGEVL